MAGDVLSSSGEEKVDKQGGKSIAWSVSPMERKSGHAETARKECEGMAAKKPSVTDGAGASYK